MKIKIYTDLSNEVITNLEYIWFTTKPTMQKMANTTRYVIEIDLPAHHFKPIADIEIKAVTLGREEE